MSKEDRSRKVLFTIGYEGRSMEDFVSCLKSRNIGIVLDIRELPLSRKKGFSKNGLRERLQREGLDYVHMRELGTPKELRSKLHEDRNYDAFFRSFLEYLGDQHEAIEKVYTFIFDSICCLMCYERHAEECHRSVVAKEISKRDRSLLSVVNL